MKNETTNETVNTEEVIADNQESPVQSEQIVEETTVNSEINTEENNQTTINEPAPTTNDNNNETVEDTSVCTNPSSQQKSIVYFLAH